MHTFFTTVSISSICGVIGNAKDYVIYVAPGIFLEVAESLKEFFVFKGEKRLEIIVDDNPEVCRLGYGEIKAVESLMNCGINIRKAEGLRIGILIVDQQAWVFSPTPLVVESTPEGVNAIQVELEQAKALVDSISPHLALDQHGSENELGSLDLLTASHTPQLGLDTFDKQDLDNAVADLKKCPPQNFDLARRVRVYHGHIQFVELSLTGCHFSRHTVSIPPKLLNVTGNPDLQERLKATYRLVNDNSELSGKKIEDAVLKLRKKYLCQLGKRFGTVILRQNKEEFLKEIDQVRKSLNEFAGEVEMKLETEFIKCQEELLKILLPVVVNNPPDDLRRGISTAKPSNEQATRYLEDVLRGIIPDTKDFVKGMALYCDFKDVTYEMLNDEEFQSALKKAFPYEDWSLPYEEYEAAKQR